MEAVSQAAALDAGIISLHEGLPDDVRSSDSISNVQSRQSPEKLKRFLEIEKSPLFQAPPMLALKLTLI